MRRGDAKGRWDTNSLFNKTDFDLFRYGHKPLDDLCADIFQGVTIKPAGAEDDIGALRVKDIDLLGRINYSNAELTAGVPDRKVLQEGDVLTPFIGETIRQHKVALFQATAGKFTVDGNVGVLRPKKNLVDPAFLAAQMTSSLITRQIDQLIGGGGVPFLGSGNAKQLRGTAPPLSIQRRLVAELDAARAERDRALAEADSLLTSIDTLVTQTLGLPAITTPAHSGYAIRFGQAKAASTLSADYFHPERMGALKAIRSLPNAPLSQLVNFQRNLSSTPGDARYIGLASVASHTGQLTNAVETAAGQCFEFVADDVLYGRLRPYLNKVWLAAFAGVSSTEFHVMRVRDRTALLPAYLAVVMRTQLIVAQTRHMMTGNTHPRLANEDVVNLLVPLTDKSAQQHVVDETVARQSEAARLRTHAETVWQRARERFEQQLLQGSTP